MQKTAARRPLKALFAAFDEMGFENVKTAFASGNVIFSVPQKGPVGQDTDSLY